MLNERQGFYWAIQIRPCIDKSGESDVIISSPTRKRTEQMASECIGVLYDIVWSHWIKTDKVVLRKVKDKYARSSRTVR